MVHGSKDYVSISHIYMVHISWQCMYALIVKYFQLTVFIIDFAFDVTLLGYS